ncbi:MAG: outer membrane beta-barrel protein [Bauldia sp.]
MATNVSVSGRIARVLKSAALALPAAGVLILAASTPATSADYRAAVAYVPPPYDPWNAFSIGVGGGVDIFRTDVDGYAEEYDWPYNSVYFSSPLKGSGGFGTVEIGKDFHNGNMIFGIFGEYNFGRKSDSAGGSWFECLCGGNEKSRVEEECEWGDTLSAGAKLTLKNSYGIMGHVGVLVNPTTQIYGIFGYTWHKYTAEVNASSTVFDDWGYDPLHISKSGTIGGLTFGIGAEMLINSHLSIKGEYRLVKLGAPGEVGGYQHGIYAQADFGKVDDHVFRGVISYKLP